MSDLEEAVLMVGRKKAKKSVGLIQR